MSGPQLRIWWIPAIPGTAFERAVETIEEGHALLDALVDYTRYLEGRALVPNYGADAGGLQALETDGEWFDAESVLDDYEGWEYVKREMPA